MHWLRLYSIAFVKFVIFQALVLNIYFSGLSSFITCSSEICVAVFFFSSSISFKVCVWKQVYVISESDHDLGKRGHSRIQIQRNIVAAEYELFAVRACVCGLLFEVITVNPLYNDTVCPQII